MKLLFDENLSPRLVIDLADLYPDSIHVSSVDLDEAQDKELWSYAHKKDYLIVSRDSDFSEMSIVHGSPPKVVWIRRGNCSTAEIEKLLRKSYSRILELYEAKNASVVLLH